MAAVTKHWTVDEIRDFPEDGQRYELVDGELLVTPSPTVRHQDAARRLFVRLHDYLKSQRAGDVWFAPADVEYGATAVVQPDLFVVPLVAGRRPRQWTELGPLLLAVEIMSPGSARADRTVKRRLYQRQGVPEYWILDLDGRIVERWRPDDDRPEILDELLIWQPPGAESPFVLELPPFWAEVDGDA